MVIKVLLTSAGSSIVIADVSFGGTLALLKVIKLGYGMDFASAVAVDVDTAERLLLVCQETLTL